MASKFDDLRELQAMLERGEVTQAEYEIVKADLLSDDGAESRTAEASREPGWYDDPSGKASHQAYWDGSNWTGQTRPGTPTPAASTTAPRRFPLGKVLLYLTLTVVGFAVVAAVASNLAGDEVSETFAEVAEGLDTDSGGSSDITQSRASTDNTDAPATPAPAAQFTRSEENAIGSAESYLSFSAFSRTGLIDQLEYEGYTNAEATKAVDYLDVDWKKQAVLSAESYLDYSAFSRSGLIEQLEYEGFSNAEATHGVDSITVDWNEQAWKSAESYLEFSTFSRSGLIDQLLYEGFTQSQATYGVDKAGL